MKKIQFSVYERFGLLMLLFLILTNLIYRVYLLYKNTHSIRPFNVKTELYGDSMVHQNKNSDDSKDRVDKIKKAHVKTFNFDPNKLTLDSLKMLGIDRYTANNLVKFRASGGVFYKASDLKKIYGMSDSMYLTLLPYINIGNNKTNAISKFDLEKKRKIDEKFQRQTNQQEITVDINSADISALSQLKGIGPVLSKRIIKYREALGGFYETTQVAEVYGLQDSIFILIENKLTISDTLIKKIRINDVSFKELLKHPYTDYDLTRLLINYRNQHGFFQSQKDLEKIYAMDPVKRNKLVRYLDFGVTGLKDKDTMLDTLH